MTLTPTPLTQDNPVLASGLCAVGRLLRLRHLRRADAATLPHADNRHDFGGTGLRRARAAGQFVDAVVKGPVGLLNQKDDAATLKRRTEQVSARRPIGQAHAFNRACRKGRDNGACFAP